MGFKCALQIKGLTIGEPAPSAKHRMNLRKAAMEAGYERASRSETLDRSRSHFNRYSGFTKGRECADAMENAVAFVTVTMNDGSTVQRKSRSDAVPGFAVICNPPAEICRSWDDDTYRRFYQDSWECLSEIKPKIFRDDNLVMTAEHYDEGVPPADNTDISQIDRHIHWIGYARDEDGKWCGNEIDAKFFVELNRLFPARMRARGWEMDDLDTTDFERSRTDKEYAAERSAKRRKSGLSVNRHLSRKSHEVQKQAAAIIQQAVQLNTAATERMNLAGELMLEADAQQQYARKKLAELEEKEAELHRHEKEYREIVALGRRAKAEILSQRIVKQTNSEPNGAEYTRRLPDIDYT